MKTLLVMAAVISYFGVYPGKMTGGWKDCSPEESKIKDFAKAAASNISQSSNSLYHSKMFCVTNAKSQVVSGIKYKIVFEMGPTVCKKNKANINIESCEPLEYSHPQTCSITVWDQPWRSSTKFYFEPCTPHVENKCNRG
uniref:U101-Liphistoxin-Lth1a_1 n=2 Tax=Liphistius TaxID=62150 RepID=A0A4Q8K6V3_9ARAC